MPTKMTEIRRALGIAEEAIAPDYARLQNWFGLTVGTKTTVPPPLFVKVKYEEPPADILPPPAKKAKKEEAPVEMPPCTIEDVGKVQLKTAEVIAAEPVPETTKLLKLQLKVGDEQRQIVSGIAQWYKPEDLIGKTIVIIANLKPATLRGVESNGMLLAAKAGKTLRLVTIDGDLPSGATIG